MTSGRVENRSESTPNGIPDRKSPGKIIVKPLFHHPASTIGAICYFPNLSEVAFTDTLMDLGMGHGPALALLITATGTSLPSWLAIGKVFGAEKALVFAPTVIILGAILGWTAGTMPSLFGYG